MMNLNVPQIKEPCKMLMGPLMVKLAEEGLIGLDDPLNYMELITELTVK